MLRSKLRVIWQGFRQMTGDDAFERYLRHHAAAHPEEPPLDRKAFFKQHETRKWEQPRRCC